MEIERIEVAGFSIPEVNKLGPIQVLLQDFGPGEGRITVTCCSQSWTSYWGGMGNDLILEFVAGCDADYLAKNLTYGIKTTKGELLYVMRVAQAVIDACSIRQQGDGR